MKKCDFRRLGRLLLLPAFCLLLAGLWPPPALAASPSAPPAPAPAAPPAAPTEILKISGCSISRAGYLDFLAAAFTERTGIRVLLKGGGSAAGLLNLTGDATDLAASCLPPEAEEVPARVRMAPVAWDALVFIVHPDNPLTSITLDQARNVFLGQAPNWQALGGPDRPLALYLQYSPRTRITQGVPYSIHKKLLGGREITADPAILKPRPSGGLAEESLARDPAGIAATGFTSARLKGDKLKMLAVDGVAPSRESIISGAYPPLLRRHLYLALGKAASPAAERFLAFVLSPEGQQLIREHGAVALDDIR